MEGAAAATPAARSMTDPGMRSLVVAARLAAGVALVTAALVVITRSAAADRGSHGAFVRVAPAVYPRQVACTTEPPPAAPIVKVRPSPRGRLRLRVTGIGGVCQASWSAARATDRDTDLTVTPTYQADAPSACGTCVVDLLVTRLGRGDYRVTVAGTTIAAHAP